MLFKFGGEMHANQGKKIQCCCHTRISMNGYFLGFLSRGPPNAIHALFVTLSQWKIRIIRNTKNEAFLELQRILVSNEKSCS